MRSSRLVLWPYRVSPAGWSQPGVEPAVAHRLVAESVNVSRYHHYLQPTGEPYLGGGLFWLPRDFMKLGQLILDGGTWRGRRPLSCPIRQSGKIPIRRLHGKSIGYIHKRRQR